MARILQAMRIVGLERQSRGDVTLASLVRMALAVSFGDQVDDLTLKVERGVLTMRGEVGRLDDIDAYEHVARQVPGVRDVDNLLRLQLTGYAFPTVLSA